MSNHKKKFKLLLDAAFPNPLNLEKLSKKANIKHIVFDFGKSPMVEDPEIYQLAVKLDRFVVTVNKKHFKKLVAKNKPGVLVVPSDLSNNALDVLLTAFITGKNPDDLYGQVVSI